MVKTAKFKGTSEIVITIQRCLWVCSGSYKLIVHCIVTYLRNIVEYHKKSFLPLSIATSYMGIASLDKNRLPQITMNMKRICDDEICQNLS